MGGFLILIIRQSYTESNSLELTNLYIQVIILTEQKLYIQVIIL